MSIIELFAPQTNKCGKPPHTLMPDGPLSTGRGGVVHLPCCGSGRHPARAFPAASVSSLKMLPAFMY
ncbi:hypothetical protein QC762_0102090 [Podospora pseudocomata]|uniref:Uncharacterized protein n=1 Tax=Podospora pseudocomata TaxID=2093779 RepID=A0ABR0G9B8_9PEZI|nr:hypothetical protein QC762_0102090 [Podospora pseudocomata]